MPASTVVTTPEAPTRVTAEWPVTTVQTKSAWADEWTFQSMFRVVKFSNKAQPQMPYAEFEVPIGDVKPSWLSLIATVEMDQFDGKYIQILQTIPASGEATDEDDEFAGANEVIKWTGVIVDVAISEHSALDSVRQATLNIQARGLEYKLSKIAVKQSYHLKAATPVLIDGVPPMNVRSPRGGTLFGNRTALTSYAPLGTAVYDITLDGNNAPYVWTHEQYANYIINAFAPTDIVLELSGRFANLGYMESAQQFEGLTVLDILNRLISPELGHHWRIVVQPDDDTWYIQVDPDFEVDIVVNDNTMLANSKQVDISDFNDTLVEHAVTKTLSTQVDTIEVWGAKTLVCGSFSFEDGTLEKGWTDADETAFETAWASGIAPEGERYKRVWTQYRVPTSWDFKLRDGIGGSPIDVALEFDAQGDIEAAETSDIVFSTKRFLRTLPLLEGYDYEPATPENKNPSGADPQYMRPLAFCKDDEGDDKWFRCDKGLPKVVGSARVDIDDHEFAFQITYNPSYILARDNWGSMPNKIKRQAVLKYDDLIVTGAFEIDRALKVIEEVPENQRSGDGSKHIITVPNAQFWYLMPSTVWDVDSTGALVHSGGGAAIILRNDVEALRSVLSIAATWFASTRRHLIFERRYLEHVASVGEIVTRFHQLAADADVYTVIISEEWDYASGAVTLETHDEIPDPALMAERIGSQGSTGFTLPASVGSDATYA